MRTETLKERPYIYGFLGLFAIVLGLVSSRHEMYVDETQVWLIARDSRNLLEMFQHLHYEGHPALWYLLVYLPAHFSSSMVWMQVINYLLSLVLAWMLLTERRWPLGLRVLALFSVFTFFHMAVMVRSYMLAGVLLVGAARCLLAERPRHFLATVLLGLAINTHFLAIPVALGIFIWLYWLSPAPSRWLRVARYKEGMFWRSAAILLASLLICYYTLRPAPDIYTPHYEAAGASTWDYLLIGSGRVWSYFVPLPLNLFSVAQQEHLAPWLHPFLLAVWLTLILFLLALSVLPTRRSRWFMISVSLAWMAAVVLTTHRPSPFHTSFLWIAFVIALMMNSPSEGDRSWLPTRFARPVLMVLVGMQLLITVHYGVEDSLHAFSGGKPTADWLMSSGFASHPLVIEPDTAGTSILAYTGIRQAYFPTCRCWGSFTVYRQGRDEKRLVTVGELETVAHQYGASPVVISHQQLTENFLRQTNLRLLYTSPHGMFWPYEDLFAYGSK